MSKKRDSKGRFKKAVAKRRTKRRRRSNPEASEPTPNPSRRRRRRRAAVATKSRRRRRNPDGGGGHGLGFPSVKQIGWGIAANMAIGFAVMRFGDKWGTGLFGQNANSPYQGEGWSGKNYIVGGLAVIIGTRALRKWQGADAAKAYNDAGWAALIHRFTYTEILAKSKWLQGTFGEVPGQAQVYDDGQGNRWLQTEQGWVSMQGLVPASPMGYQPLGYQPLGYQPLGYHNVRQPHALAGLVPASPMGAMEEARDIDRSDQEGNLASHTGRKYYGRREANRMALYDSAWGQAF